MYFKASSTLMSSSMVSLFFTKKKKPFTGLGAAGTPTARAAYLPSTNFATNGALLMEVTADWSVANAGNSCRLDILTVEVI
jgi:hypothetical protein